jgi:DNA-binding MarR family transcriptional regulator
MISYCDTSARLDRNDYRQLLELRSALRRFLHWSDLQARAAGVTPAQHQLLLAIRGHPNPAGPTLGEVAELLLVRHHSAVGLVNRAARGGLVRRELDPSGRCVRLRLTDAGEAKLAGLAARHLEELRRLTPMIAALRQAAVPSRPAVA